MHSSTEKKAHTTPTPAQARAGELFFQPKPQAISPATETTPQPAPIKPSSDIQTKSETASGPPSMGSWNQLISFVSPDPAPVQAIAETPEPIAAAPEINRAVLETSIAPGAPSKPAQSQTGAQPHLDLEREIQQQHPIEKTVQPVAPPVTIPQQEVAESISDQTSTPLEVRPPAPTPVLTTKPPMNPIPVNQPTGVQASGLSIGAPDDRFEREADEMAEKVQRTPKKQFAGASDSVVPPGLTTSIQRSEDEDALPAIQAKFIQRLEADDEAADVQAQFEQPLPDLQRSGDGSLSASASFASRLNTTSAGSPLPAPTQAHMESVIQADFSNVRVHHDTQAAQLSNSISAKAFTHKNDIYFNSGEYNPNSSDGQFLLAHELTHTVQQGAALQREPVSATSKAPAIQRSWLGDQIGEYLNYIPGYTLFTVIIGFNPVTAERVERNATNLVHGLLTLIPVFGQLIFNELQSRNILSQAFEWVEGQLTRLGLTRARFDQLINQATAIVADVTNLGSMGDMIGALFTGLYNDVIAFAESLKDQLIAMIKAALVAVLKALAIDRLPAYRLLTKILHRDPITGEAVQATTAEIVADFLIMIGKEEELRQMQERGTLQRTADWLDQQIGQFMSLFDELVGIFNRVWDAFSLESLRDPMGVLEGIVTDFSHFVGRVFDYAVSVAVQVLQFIKDALLGWLRTHANGIRGYRLLTVLLGKDPVTQEAVERNARNILGGFVQLVAGEEKFQQIEQSGAIERLATWLEATAERLGITFQMIRDLFIGLWNSFTINDLVHPIDAFTRILDQFGEPLSRVVAFLFEIIKKVIEIVLSIMEVPIDVGQQIVERVMAAFETIKQDPMAFFLNLLRAIKQGFIQFFDKIGQYLLQGVVGWLMRELQTAGIQPPQDFSLRSIIGFVFEVLGITMERIWQKLAEHPSIGPERVARIRGALDTLTGIWTIIQEVMTEGPGALWRHLQEQLSNLWDTVLDAVKNWITEQIVTQVVQRLLSMLDPSGVMAVINSVVAMYRAVQSFIERLREIMEIINSFVGGILEIARGNVQPAADYLERTMASAMPTIIGFLANQVGLRGLGRRIGEMIERVRELVDRGLTWLVEKMVTMGQSLLAMGRRALGGGDQPEQPHDERWTSAVNAVKQNINQLENEGIEEDQIRERLPNWKREHGFTDLKLETTDEEWIIKGSMSPQRDVDKVKKPGSKGNPFKLMWPKPKSADYPPLYFGGRVGEPKSQSVLRGIYTRGQNDSTGEPVEEFTPHSREALSQSGSTIGLSSKYQISLNKVIGPLSTATTPGGGKLNRALAPYGFVPSQEGLDADHVTEIQFGGVDELENMWPLDASTNQGAGSSLARAEIEYPDSGKRDVVSNLKNYSSRKYYFKIKGFI